MEGQIANSEVSGDQILGKSLGRVRGGKSAGLAQQEAQGVGNVDR